MSAYMHMHAIYSHLACGARAGACHSFSRLRFPPLHRKSGLRMRSREIVCNFNTDDMFHSPMLQPLFRNRTRNDAPELLEDLCTSLEGRGGGSLCLLNIDDLSISLST